MENEQKLSPGLQQQYRMEYREAIDIKEGSTRSFPPRTLSEFILHERKRKYMSADVREARILAIQDVLEGKPSRY